MKKQVQYLKMGSIFCLSILTFSASAQDTKIRFYGQPGFEQNYSPKFEKSSVYFRGGQ